MHLRRSMNDYGAEGINSKSDTLYDVVSGFMRDGVPIDAVGFQCHFDLGQVPDTLQQNLQRFADLGLDVAITELDINLGGLPNATSLAQQAQDFWTVVNACLHVERCVSVVRSEKNKQLSSRCLVTPVMGSRKVFLTRESFS